MVELLGDILTEYVASSSLVDSPPASVIGVGPNQIADRAILRHLLESFQRSDVVQCFNAGRQTSMEAKVFIFYNSRDGKTIKDID